MRATALLLARITEVMVGMEEFLQLFSICENTDCGPRQTKEPRKEVAEKILREKISKRCAELGSRVSLLPEEIINNNFENKEEEDQIITQLHLPLQQFQFQEFYL